MLPSVISSRPAIIRKVVDLPHPDGPTRTTNSSSSMTRLALLTATTLPYRLVTFSSTTLANALTPLLRQKSAQPPNVTIRPTATCVLPAAVNFPKSEAPRLPSTDTARQASADRAVIARRPARAARDTVIRDTGKCTSRSEEHTSELQSRENLVCRLLLEK